jgi:thiamine biosynthesis protein ThiS
VTALRIKVNGEEREVIAGATLSDLVSQLALVPERLAIEHNRAVVRRVDWPRTHLAEGDRIEIVHFVGGGMETVTSDKQ